MQELIPIKPNCIRRQNELYQLKKKLELHYLDKGIIVYC